MGAGPRAPLTSHLRVVGSGGILTRGERHHRQRLGALQPHLLPLADRVLQESAPQVLDAALAALEPLEDFTAAAIETALREAIVDGLGIKPRLAFGPVRTAVSGQRISPPLFESLEILGRQSTLARLTALRARLAQD